MRWTSDWRIYFIAATLFVVAATLAIMNDGPGLRPILGFVMAICLVLIGSKAKREAKDKAPPG